MVSVGDLARHVTPFKPDGNIFEAAAVMKNENVTIVPVCDENDRLLGIVTDRAIAVSGIADKQAGSATIQEVMEKPSMVLSPEMKPEEAAALMNESRLTEVVVADVDRFIGIVSYFHIKEKTNA
ncbi:CBS domain-containing protein [Pseudalkalibacillus hwajinpoensis]|uniref:CBS domain-containing protein n=1 Tax=Guptibacillus hwajinpoensis TaxID=208199 RepID=UPI00325A78BA